MDWKRHYTGIDTWEWEKATDQRRASVQLYAHRTSETQLMRFMRVSGKVCLGRFTLYPALGIFLHRTNHVDRQRGFEIFTSHLHFGYTQRNMGFGVSWSGSSVKPYEAFTVKLTRVFIGAEVPGWWKRFREWRRMREEMLAEADYREFCRRHPSHPAAQYEPDDDPYQYDSVHGRGVNT